MGITFRSARLRRIIDRALDEGRRSRPDSDQVDAKLRRLEDRAPGGVALHDLRAGKSSLIADIARMTEEIADRGDA